MPIFVWESTYKLQFAQRFTQKDDLKPNATQIHEEKNIHFLPTLKFNEIVAKCNSKYLKMTRKMITKQKMQEF